MKVLCLCFQAVYPMIKQSRSHNRIRVGEKILPAEDFPVNNIYTVYTHTHINYTLMNIQ